MQALPHHYEVNATLTSDRDLILEAPPLQPLATAAPLEFDGPGDLWSPETMLVGAIAGCFILTFRAIARASSFPWLGLSCAVEGLLERTEGILRFTSFTIRPTLEIPAGVDRDRAMLLLEKAERGCLISNSLRATMRLDPHVIEAPAEAAKAH